jgi:hypothetical protein
MKPCFFKIGKNPNGCFGNAPGQLRHVFPPNANDVSSTGHQKREDGRHALGGWFLRQGAHGLGVTEMLSDVVVDRPGKGGVLFKEVVKHPRRDFVRLGIRQSNGAGRKRSPIQQRERAEKPSRRDGFQRQRPFAARELHYFNQPRTKNKSRPGRIPFLEHQILGAERSANKMLFHVVKNPNGKGLE